MRRLGLGFGLLLVLAACAAPAGSTMAGPTGTYIFVGWPRLPAVLTTGAPAVPDLPASGPVGRAALIITIGRPVLVLEDGRRYLLPAPPAGEGRQGSVLATLSPDGRWLGYRDAHQVGERRYVIRDLTARASVVTDRYPGEWSSDARYLSLIADGTNRASGRFDALTGSVTPAGGTEPEPLWVSLLPDGPPVSTTAPSPAPPQLRLLVDEYSAQLILSDPAIDDECWYPVAVRLSPDGRTVSALLRYQPGLVAGTSDQKVRRHPEGTAQLVLIDASTGHVTQRIPMVEAGGSKWALAADTGVGLLLWHGTDTLVRLDVESGAIQPVMRVPDARLVLLPGQIETASDG
jgi:hypothetical protein